MPDETPPRMFLVPEPVLRGVLEYLMTRPYREVWEGIEALKRAQIAPTPEAAIEGDRS